MNYLKAEIYRFMKGKTIFYSALSIILYTLFGNYVYFINNLDTLDLYNNFGQEYLLIFLVLSFSVMIFLFNEDLKNKMYYEYDRTKMFRIKLIVWFICLILVFVMTLISSFVISLLFSLKVTLTKELIINIINILPIIIFYNLLLLIILLISCKASFSALFSFFSYTFSSYISLSIPMKDSFYKYLVIFNLDFNNLLIAFHKALIIFGFVFIILLIVSFGLYKKKA